MATKTRRLADLLANIDDDSKVTSAGLLDATITAADLAPNSVDSDELVNGAVDTSHIANDAVDADKLASNAVVSASIVDANITTAKIASNAITSAKVGDVIGTKPHIQPGILQPAVSGKLLDGTTNHSGDYGTTQADGHKYFWTEIKGSKPIPDPRIGTHFGSQRHKFKSLQLLEQETAAHGYNVWSLDGRQHMRVWTAVTGGQGMVTHYDGRGHGIRADTAAMTWAMEITGYFSAANMLCYQNATTHMNSCDIQIDGVTKSNNINYGTTTSGTPLESRYVDSHSLVKLDVGTIPLGLHTLRFWSDNTGGNGGDFAGIELIAHGKFTDATCDTTSGDATVTHNANAQMVAGMSVTGTGIPAGATIASVTSTTAFELSANATATNSNQTLTFGVPNMITPAQDVVSYGKKFSVSETAHHYNPFATKGDGSVSTIPNNTTGDSVATGWAGSTSAYWEPTLDTATSLGLAAWVEGGAYYRPVNGGRVVKWIDSTGAIKTSVNMMPPSAKTEIGTHSGDATPTGGTNWSTQKIPIFSTGAVDHSQSEIAKCFSPWEFGNGAGRSGYSDITNQAATGGGTRLSYVMDDGLTAESWTACRPWTVGNSVYSSTAGSRGEIIFIGTGISLFSFYTGAGMKTRVYAQNLPYGTHVLRLMTNSGAHTQTKFDLDGVQLKGYSTDMMEYGRHNDITVHQPKMPPIPENACIIADYMLMADVVPNTTSGDGQHTVHKGTRKLCASRDFRYNGAAWTYDTGPNYNYMVDCYSTAGSAYYEIPFFGDAVGPTNYISDGDRKDQTIKIDGAVHATASVSAGNYTSGTGIWDNNSVGDNAQYGAKCLLTGIETGQHVLKSTESGAGWGLMNEGIYISPLTHTSSHYQEFETPFLKELVGGDRNMEQTNLVVTADGKTWDEYTRDTSYIGNTLVNASITTSNITSSWTDVRWDEHRGMFEKIDYHNKDWAIAYDQFICLKSGTYAFTLHISIQTSVGGAALWKANGPGGSFEEFLEMKHPATDKAPVVGRRTIHCKRGDRIKARGLETNFSSIKFSNFLIERV